MELPNEVKAKIESLLNNSEFVDFMNNLTNEEDFSNDNYSDDEDKTCKIENYYINISINIKKD